MVATEYLAWECCFWVNGRNSTFLRAFLSLCNSVLFFAGTSYTRVSLCFGHKLRRFHLISISLNLLQCTGTLAIQRVSYIYWIHLMEDAHSSGFSRLHLQWQSLVPLCRSLMAVSTVASSTFGSHTQPKCHDYSLLRKSIPVWFAVYFMNNGTQMHYYTLHLSMETFLYVLNQARKANNDQMLLCYWIHRERGNTW